MAEPAGVLGRIATAKREELARRFDGVSLDSLRSRARPSERSLSAALAKPGSRFILEIKKASPSEGALRADADVAALATSYNGVADALSVLCDGAHFGGSLEDVVAARGRFDGPILAKDFFIDLRQVAEARIAGADAVLVMLSLLEDDAAAAMIAEARRFRMDALVEVHDEGEMKRALALDATIVGINNRDLRDLSIDLSTTERLAPLAPGRILVSESGILARNDVERLATLVDGFLVGSALMKADEPSQAARELIFGRVKLCGLNDPADLPAARPAAFGGLIFAPGSPRRLTTSAATPLAETLRVNGAKPIGVFKNAALDKVREVAQILSLHAVQLHGQEDEAYVRSLRRHFSGEIWTAVSVGRDPLEGRGGDRLLFDHGEGGSGRAFDWDRIAGHPDLARSLVAGGIGPSNAGAARALGAHAIDVGSTVDAAPGVKSAEKIGALFEGLRPASRRERRECA